MSKKIIVLQGANEDFCEHVSQHIRDMDNDDFLVLTHDIKIYDIDECYEFNLWLNKHGVKLK